jgi:hypothetical protein
MAHCKARRCWCRSLPSLDRRQLRAFGEAGFVIAPNVVTAALRDTAMREIDRMIVLQPPPVDHRGFHFYWAEGLTAGDPLLAQLIDGGAFALAASLVAPLAMLVPRQAQVSLNIPPWRHRPGGPHLDGLTPPDAQRPARHLHAPRRDFPDRPD